MTIFPRMLTMNDGDFRKTVHSVLVLPVYMDNELIPLSLQDYNADYRKNFYEMISGRNNLILTKVIDILTNGKYKLTVMTDDKIGLSVPVLKKTYSLVGNNCTIIFNDNKRYSLSADTVNDLLNRYKADAVLFHYVQVNKVRHLYIWDNGSLNLPELCLQYKALLYIRDGKNIYDDYKQILEVSKNIKNCGNYEPALNIYEEGAGIIIQLEEKVSGGNNSYYAGHIEFRDLALNKMDDNGISALYNKRIGLYLKDLYLK